MAYLVAWWLTCPQCSFARCSKAFSISFALIEILIPVYSVYRKQLAAAIEFTFPSVLLLRRPAFEVCQTATTLATLCLPINHLPQCRSAYHYSIYHYATFHSIVFHYSDCSLMALTKKLAAFDCLIKTKQSITNGIFLKENEKSDLQKATLCDLCDWLLTVAKSEADSSEKSEAASNARLSYVDLLISSGAN